MKDRMHNWRALFALLGWLGIIGGAIGALFTYGATLALVLIGMSLLFTAAMLDWMDGVLEHLSVIRENQQTISEHLYQIEHSQKEYFAKAAPQETVPDKETPAEETAAQANADSPAQSEPGVYNAQREADIYRLSRDMRK